jgi:pyruvate ferredoxin oxidoreductase gamma subunit
MGGRIPNAGNSIWNDLSASRTGWLPVFHSEKCIHCGLCDMVCADLCLVWKPAGLGSTGYQPVPSGDSPDGMLPSDPRVQSLSESASAPVGGSPTGAGESPALPIIPAGVGSIHMHMMGIDYRYCKGCMRCVESCPTEALTREIETPGLADQLRVPLFPELLK